MRRTSKLLFAVLAFAVFLGSCSLSIGPTWNLEQRLFSRPVLKDADRKRFPVLVVDSGGRYSVAALGSIPNEKVLVVGELDEKKVNRDLRASIQLEGDYTYFQISSRSAESMSVSVEKPTRHNSILKGWYAIKDGAVIPRRIFDTGPGYPFLVLIGAFAFGLLATGIFVLIFRPIRAKK